MRLVRWTIVGVLLAGMGQMAHAQFTVLDANPAAGTPAEALAEAPRPCGNQPISIARMSWPSAALLAEIHARILASEFGCEVRVLPGDMSATTSSMGSSGQPAVAPEMWVTRIADVWNGAIEAQMVRSAAPTFAETVFEGWFMPDYAVTAGVPSAAELATALSAEGGKTRFISCPADWACALINRNLLRAHGLEDRVELIEPANRFEMDNLIAEAVNRRETFLFYYWQPNAVLEQLDFVGLDMGAYDEEAAKCLARLSCPEPKPSAFASETVVIAVSDWLFAEAPRVASYFQRASMALSDMNALLAQTSEPNATIESVADAFVAERRDLWGEWVGETQ